jgi:hypothetical protein
MLGEILLKMVSVLTPDDVRQMKADGPSKCLEKVEDILHLLDDVAVSWHNGEYGVMSLADVQLWADVREKLNDLWSALREG